MMLLATVDIDMGEAVGQYRRLSIGEREDIMAMRGRAAPLARWPGCSAAASLRSPASCAATLARPGRARGPVREAQEALVDAH